MLIAADRQGETWKKVMGAEILFAPINVGMLRRARRAALKTLNRDEGEQSEADAAEQLEELGDALSEALIMAGARDWRDVMRQVVDEEGEPILGADKQPRFEPLPFTAENLAATISDPVVFEAFDEAYVMPFAKRERAKNVSAASPSGTGAAATQGKGTVSSPAKPKRAAAAKRVRTVSKKPRKKKPKASGKS
jgi:hypothetical protein